MALQFVELEGEEEEKKKQVHLLHFTSLDQIKWAINFEAKALLGVSKWHNFDRLWWRQRFPALNIPSFIS